MTSASTDPSGTPLVTPFHYTEMEHFLSGLEPGPQSHWYHARPPVPNTPSHDFTIGTNTFSLIPVSVPENQGNSAFRPPMVGKIKQEKEVDIVAQTVSKATPSPSPVSPLTSSNSKPSAKNALSSIVRQMIPLLTASLDGLPQSQTKLSNSDRWDTKKVCNICGKVLSRGDKLKNHMRIHTNNFPHQCDVCGQGFLRSEGLRNHVRIHTGERPFICNLCGKAYTRKDKLKRHAIIHTGEKPYVCQNCGKAFYRKDKLQRHENIHRVEKPFSCVPCRLDFTRQETFTAHMERKHPERLPYTVVTGHKLEQEIVNNRPRSIPISQSQATHSSISSSLSLLASTTAALNHSVH